MTTARYDESLLYRDNGGALGRLKCTECGIRWELELSRTEFSNYDQRNRTLDQWVAITTGEHDHYRHPASAP